MISVIIPLMLLEPYATQVKDCLKSLEKQTAERQVFVEIHQVQEYNEKNRLLNQGIEKAKGDIIWFCDADFLLPNADLLERMEVKLKEDNLDVIYPMFYSDSFRGYKLADGGAFIKKDVLAKFGKLDESLIGISNVTWPLLDWCLDNIKLHCSTEFLIELNYEPFRVKGWANPEIKSEMKKRYPKFRNKLKARGYWPE